MAPPDRRGLVVARLWAGYARTALAVAVSETEAA